jgi:hypothetical protein
MRDYDFGFSPLEELSEDELELFIAASESHFLTEEDVRRMLSDELSEEVIEALNALCAQYVKERQEQQAAGVVEHDFSTGTITYVDPTLEVSFIKPDDGSDVRFFGPPATSRTVWVTLDVGDRVRYITTEDGGARWVGAYTPQ